MSLFKKEKKQLSIQDMHQELSNLQFQLGRHTLELDALNKQIDLTHEMINEKIAQMNKLAAQLQKTKEQVKDEITDTIQKGQQTNETLI